MSHSTTTDGARGQFTIVQLLVAIGMIAVLLAIAGPIILEGNRAARDQNCAHNLSQIGKGFTRWKKASNGQIQIDENWFRGLATYLEEDPRIFHCPEHESQDVTDMNVSYGMNNRADLLRSGEKIVLLDYEKTLANYVGAPVPEGTSWRNFYDDWPALNAPRHTGRINSLHRDGRVESWSPNDIDPLECDLYIRFWKPARAIGLNRNCGEISLQRD